MVATKSLVGGKRHKRHTKKHAPKRKIGAKAKKTIAVPKRTRYVKPGAKSIAKDPLRKCGKVVKSGPHKGKCPVVLSKQGAKVRAAQLARKGSKKKSHRKKK